MFQPSVLLIDDNTALANAYQLALEELGFRVVTASSGDDALAQGKTATDSSVAVVDLQLEGMDGAETIRELHERRPGMRFIAMSGKHLSPYFGRLADMGVRHFLPKPFRVDALVGSILEVA